MKFSELFSWAGFAGIGGGLDQMSIPEGIEYSGKSGGLSFGSKLLIASGLTLIGLYAVKRMIK